MISDICFCFVILLLKHNLACDDVKFVRDEAVTGSKSDTSSLTLAYDVIKQSECAIYCYNTAECQSFFYNKGTWTCRLHSSLFRATDSSLVPSAGDEYFRPIACSAFRVNTVPFSSLNTSTTNGTEALNVVCNDGYKMTDDPGTMLCDNDGFWPTITGTCKQRHWINPPVTFGENIPGNMFVGASISYTARLTGRMYTLNVFSDNADIELHVLARDDGSVWGRQRLNGTWVNTVTDTRDPFRPLNTTFTCLMETKKDKIEFSVNGSEYFSFPYIQGPTDIYRFVLQHDLELLEVDMRI
ncbi:uncharacterized protein LOC124148095 [Haliotis rufescens]|uniref:uncharacterized protein LOC124148095 n=1 Tax=Haliotis rufescens TaxID=6454 RepID=UPI00201F265E|nr:uncharacterized protein LOC124148095 [Haliotis rufescens]